MRSLVFVGLALVACDGDGVISRQPLTVDEGVSAKIEEGVEGEGLVFCPSGYDKLDLSDGSSVCTVVLKDGESCKETVRCHCPDDGEESAELLPIYGDFDDLVACVLDGRDDVKNRILACRGMVDGVDLICRDVRGVVECSVVFFNPN